MPLKTSKGRNNNPNLKCTFRPSIDYVRIKGSYRKTYKRGGNKQKLIILASIGKKSDLVTQENFNNRIGVVRAIFPDGETCEFEATRGCSHLSQINTLAKLSIVI